jgi:hypothetical protein
MQPSYYIRASFFVSPIEIALCVHRSGGLVGFRALILDCLGYIYYNLYTTSYKVLNPFGGTMALCFIQPLKGMNKGKVIPLQAY